MDIVPYALTLLIGLFVSPEMGMIVGTLSHLCILLYSSGNPKVSIRRETVRLITFTPKSIFYNVCFFFQLQNQNSDYLVITPDRALFFPSVETIRDQLTSNTTSDSETKEDLEANNIDLPREKLPIVLDFSKVCEMDFTAAKVCQFSLQLFIKP